MIDIELIANCDLCEEKIEVEDIDSTCEKCLLNQEREKIIDMMRYILIDHRYVWEDKEHYIGFESEEEKQTYLLGVKKGFYSAVFWMTDYFGMVSEFEKLDKESK